MNYEGFVEYWADGKRTKIDLQSSYSIAYLLTQVLDLDRKVKIQNVVIMEGKGNG